LQDFDAAVTKMEDAVRSWPIAATVLCQTMRLGEGLTFQNALMAESMAYSTLLGGAEFRRWLRTRPGWARPQHEGKITITRQDDHISLMFDNPDQRNAVTAAMRDTLYESLANALDDPTTPTVSLRGAGKCFSTGGSLPEFGTATDLAQAHIVRISHSCARLIDALGDRIDVYFHGACAGYGLEVPAAAARRTASANAWFQLPELRMGLIPGAGGTVTVKRAIGRHRTTWMVLTGKRIDAIQALDWGLIHEISAP
jgi:enoyl-CoA hydratase/carnithine racemase